MNVRTWTALSLAAVIALTAAGCGGKKETETVIDTTEPNSSLGLTLGYADGLTVVEDPDALQRAVDEAFSAAAEEGLGVEYKNSAISTDGLTFSCYLANPASSGYDVFFALYGDTALTDELYLSQLVPPGKAITEVTLNHPLLPGNNNVSVVYTQVAVENGEQVINNQATVNVVFVYNQ